MSLVDRILAGVEHYANAIFVRTYILRELLRARRRSNKIDNEFIKEAFTRPRWQEDFVLLLRFFDSSETVTLIDVGANDGTWTKKFLSIYPKASVIAIEPVPANFARFSAMHAGDPRVLALNVAAGEREGELELFVNDDDVAGVGASAYRYESGITNYSATTTSHRVRHAHTRSNRRATQGSNQGSRHHQDRCAGTRSQRVERRGFSVETRGSRSRRSGALPILWPGARRYGNRSNSFRRRTSPWSLSAVHRASRQPLSL